MRFACEVSTACAEKLPALTLDLLKEWTNGFSKGGMQQKIATTHLLEPWLPNLEVFCHPARGSADSAKLVRDFVRSLISITMSEFAVSKVAHRAGLRFADRQDMHLLLQMHVWRVLAQMRGDMPEILFSELLKAGTEAQMGSSRAECVGDILCTISNPGIRGKLIAKLRKAIARTCQSATTTLLDHSLWPEICTLVRYNALLAFEPFTQVDAQLHLPELLHSLTMLVGIGSLPMRQTLYSLMINLLRSLARIGQVGQSNPALLSDLLQQAQEDEMLGLFGLARTEGLTGLVSSIKEDEGVVLLANVQSLATFFDDVLSAASPSTGMCYLFCIRQRLMS